MRLCYTIVVTSTITFIVNIHQNGLVSAQYVDTYRNENINVAQVDPNDGLPMYPTPPVPVNYGYQGMNAMDTLSSQPVPASPQVPVNYDFQDMNAMDTLSSQRVPAYPQVPVNYNFQDMNAMDTSSSQRVHAYPVSYDTQGTGGLDRPLSNTIGNGGRDDLQSLQTPSSGGFANQPSLRVSDTSGVKPSLQFGKEVPLATNSLQKDLDDDEHPVNETSAKAVLTAPTAGDLNAAGKAAKEASTPESTKVVRPDTKSTVDSADDTEDDNNTSGVKPSLQFGKEVPLATNSLQKDLDDDEHPVKETSAKAVLTVPTAGDLKEASTLESVKEVSSDTKATVDSADDAKDDGTTSAAKPVSKSETKKGPNDFLQDENFQQYLDDMFSGSGSRDILQELTGQTFKPKESEESSPYQKTSTTLTKGVNDFLQDENFQQYLDDMFSGSGSRDILQELTGQTFKPKESEESSPYQKTSTTLTKGVTGGVVTDKAVAYKAATDATADIKYEEDDATSDKDDDKKDVKGPIGNVEVTAATPSEDLPTEEVTVTSGKTEVIPTCSGVISKAKSWFARTLNIGHDICASKS
ncbi:unnamed protein product [Peronospora belbahrii]|uniref:Uncharacterized protein n=1 Tax=Peronospora belbahrii TaxID=622444 RepID=A0AAU9KVI9_9STRA|nr:unnamed protein product [Peronospora belbahrii]